MITEGRLLGAARSRLCPSCGGQLIPGPRGGASQNFYCLACHAGWNLHGIDYGVIGVEAIGPTRPELVQFFLGVQDGMAVHRAELEAEGRSAADIEATLAGHFDKLARMGLPPLPPQTMRNMLKADGFTDQEIDEVFAFAQIVEPSGHVRKVNEATFPELRGIMHRLFRGKTDEQS